MADQDSTRIETREVLAVAYGRRPPQYHTHAVRIDSSGRVAEVLCGTVKPENIADAGSMDAGGTGLEPTCSRCALRLRNGGKRIKASTEGYFWARVRKTETCWLWIGRIDKGGYGLRYLEGPKGPMHQQAHRVSWTLHFGEIPAGMLVCHHCDVRNCVRPDHLFLGTTLINARDRERKGRGALVKGHPGPNLTAKLTAEIVLRLRVEAKDWTLPKRRLYRLLATQHGVSETCIREAIEGKSWINL